MRVGTLKRSKNGTRQWPYLLYLVKVRGPEKETCDLGEQVMRIPFRVCSAKAES